MPPKKRKPIGKVLPEHRLRINRERASTSRAAESVGQRENRLRQNRNRVSTSRAAETPQEHTARILNVRERTLASRNSLAFHFQTPSRVLIIPNCMLQLPLKRLRFNQISPFASNNKKFRNDIVTERLSRQDKDIMELNQDPIGIKSDGPTETTTEGRQEVRETGETTAPLADVVTQLSTLLTRVKISDGSEATISPFDGTYSATQFFQTFDRKMEDASMGEQEKLLRLPNYLVRQPLELFRKLRLADRSYFQVRQILLDLYPESSEASFAKYFAMKLTGQANLETYYREKNRHGIATRTSTRGDPRDTDRRTAIQRPAPSPRSASREPRRVVPTCKADPRAQSHPDAQVHGMHLFRRPTASSAARDTGTANADVDQSRRPTKKSGQCKRSQNHQFRFHNNQVKTETPQPSSPFETEVGSLNQLTVKLFLAPNVSCPFLIDTGASLSIVPYNIYHMLKTHLPNLTLEGHSLHLQTLNGFAKTMGKLSIPLTIGQISRKENFHVVNAPLPFGILSINSLHKFRLTIDFNKCTIFQLGAPLSTLSYHFNHVSNVCTYWQCQAMSQKIFPASQLSAYDNHCVHSLRKTHLSTCPFFTKANCLFYMPSNNQTTTTSTYEPVQNAPTQRDNSHTKNIGDHTPLHNSHMTNPHNELDTHTNTQQNPLPHAYYNTTPNTHYTPQFTTLLQRYTHIFSQDKFNVPCLRIPPVKIPTNSEKIITIRPYRVPICDQQEIRNQIQQMLENDIIEQSFSPFSSPVTLVTKRDKTKRFCIDYRKVNELISSDVHPLPRIEDILDHLAQAKYFSTADISSAYWQVPIHPDSRPLSYRDTDLTVWHITLMISSFTPTHWRNIKTTCDNFSPFAKRRSYNFAKCEFFKQSINFLGYTITAGTITPLTRNTDIIHAIKQPHNRKTLQSFLGAVNVYNKFIPEYARLRAPLNNLLKKDVVWNWNEACQEAFIDLKGNLTQHPILHLYKEGLPCQVYCDASTLGIAGILKQVHPDGNVYPAQYFSRTLRPHEKNYSISELECLAIVESVEKFRIYIMGKKFTIFSDHHALQWLKTIKNPSGRLFRWSLRLSSYEYEVRYIKGKLQYEADLLSRNPFCGFLDATLIKTHQPPPSKESTLTIDRNGLHTVSRKGVTKIILPKPLIQQLLQTVHTQYNHPGISQMSRIISTQYYWQGMSKDIKQKVKTCPTCQLTKRPVGPTYGELSQPPESKEPFDLLSLDTIAGFAKYGNTKIYLHVIVDHFSRYAWAFPSKSTSTTTYQQVLKRVFQDGSPKRLLTDRAPAFTSPKFRSFLLNRNIHPLITTSNNPQANGLCERLNATLTGKLRLLHQKILRSHGPKSLRFKPTSSEPFRHLDPAIFATRRFASLFPDVKNCKPDNQLNHITPLPKDIKQENCESTNHSNSTINKVQANISESPVTKIWTNMGQYPIFHLIFILYLEHYSVAGRLSSNMKWPPLTWPHNRRHVQLFLTWSTNAAHPVILDQEPLQVFGRSYPRESSQSVTSCGGDINPDRKGSKVHRGLELLEEAGTLAHHQAVAIWTLGVLFTFAFWGVAVPLDQVPYVPGHTNASATETYELIKEAFGDAALSRSRTFEWFSRFQKGREKVNDDQHTGRPRSLRCEENKLKIKELIKSNRKFSIKDLSSETELSVGLCHQIVTKDLDMIRTSLKFVPQILTEEQKENGCKKSLPGMRHGCISITRKPNVKSSQWIERGEPKPKKARFTKSKVKTLLVTFFYINGLVHHEFIPFGRTINQEVYLEIMRRLREVVRLKRPKRWQNNDWILHVDNARPHTAHVVLQFLAKNSTIQIPHPPYSPDLAPNDFFL
ncbi:hypothetical protein LAZ67_2006134 [Cordylochernes scorpioides]|uniref:RNA-directed DNA polymerase n=1 Tax=Cordylochernes scorpioides TaxID=51811 RepID=A0ABY6K515_9ARAC|nr:hypothetical protein LAZ67_2006134 [Cordylochernes scorpioides]